MFAGTQLLRGFACLLTISTTAMLGCSGGESAAPDPNPPAADSPAEAEDTSSETALNDQPLQSPARTQAKRYEEGEHGATRNSSPSEVCQAFVSSLHEGDIVGAERLLTLTSRITIHKSGLELDNLAGESASYVIGNAKYATQLKDLAYVDCHVHEKDQEGRDLDFTVTWMLKPESGYGWRVFGMVMKEDNEIHMLNFELPEHAQVVSDIYLAEQLTTDEPVVRQAENSDGDRVQ